MGRYRVYTPPSLDEAARTVEDAVSRKHYLVMAGVCRAEYEGRGASEAGEGDKLVIVKPDGSVIIHGPRGFKPLNWQPDTSYIGVSLEGPLLKLSFVRRRPREVLNVYCSEVGFIAVIEAPLEGGFWMYLTEEDLRSAVISFPEEILGERILFVEKEAGIQGSGAADIYGYDSRGRPVVIEVKRVKAGEDAVRQLQRYVEGFERARGSRPRGILVAPDATEAARRLVEALGLEFRRVDLKRIYSLVKPRRRRTLEDYMPGGVGEASP